MFRALFVGLILLSGCRGHRAPAPTPPDLEAIREELARRKSFIGPGDMVSIQVYRHKDLCLDQVVSEDGTISLPTVGEIAVSGKTRKNLEDEIAQRLGDGGIKNPQVAVLIKKLISAKVSVYGEVKKPGTFPYESGMTVVQAITLAAGFEKTAQQDAVVIIHASGERLEVPVRAIGLGQVPNVPLMPGDIVYVPESYF